MTTAAASPTPHSILLAPQSRLSTPILTLVALVQAGIGLVLSRSGIRFDGALDVHRTWLGNAPTFALAVLDQLAAVPIAAVGAALVLRMWGQRLSFLSLVRLFGVARLPLVFAAPLVLLLPIPASLARKGIDASLATDGLLLAGLGAVIGVAWMVAILSIGLRDDVSQRGGRLVAVVLSVIVGAEVASKLLLAAAG